jgi:hypothetical protein
MPFSISRLFLDDFVVVFDVAVFWLVEVDAVEGPAVTSSYAGGGPSIGAAIVILEVG